MKKFILINKNNTLIRNIIILMSGTVGAQLVAMMLSPVITRIYGPEAFGVMGTFNALINIIIPISSLTFPIAIVDLRQYFGHKKVKFSVFL